MRRRSVQGGFTLIEVVVALAIFALCIGAVLESFSGAMRRTAKARESEAALLVAESVLASLRASERYADAEQSGTSGDDFRWKAEIAPYPLALDDANPWQAYRVAIAVFPAAGTEPAVVLNSVELGKAD